MNAKGKLAYTFRLPYRATKGVIQYINRLLITSVRFTRSFIDVGYFLIHRFEHII